MSEEQKEDIDKIIIHAQALIEDTRKAKSTLQMWVKVLIGTFIAALVSVVILVTKVDANHDSVVFLQKDYAPLWFLTEMIESDKFMAQEIAATFGASEEDKEKLKEIQAKYSEFKIRVINRIAQERGGISTTTRGNYVPGTGGSQ